MHHPGAAPGGVKGSPPRPCYFLPFSPGDFPVFPFLMERISSFSRLFPNSSGSFSTFSFSFLSKERGRKIRSKSTDERQTIPSCPNQMDVEVRKRLAHNSSRF